MEIFFPPLVFVQHFVSCFFLCVLFSNFELSVTTMAPKKTVPTKRHYSGSTSWAITPPSDDLRRFISWEAKRLYHKSLCIRSFVPEFSDLECVLQFHHLGSRLANLVCSLNPQSGPGHPRVLLQPAIPSRHHSVCAR